MPPAPAQEIVLTYDGIRPGSGGESYPAAPVSVKVAAGQLTHVAMGDVMGRRETGSAASRRQFIVVGGVGAAAACASAASAAVPLSGGSARGARGALGLLGGASIGAWQGRVGESFRVADSQALLTLVAVEPLPARGARPLALRRRQGFAAVFEAKGGEPPDGDAVYVLRRAGEGSLALHVGPRIASDGAARYLAVLN
ncbi:hypothetical protein E2493_20720 [Sphingomonas parva]|uniref:DUF6916 domain-containing protein n=1 Tax=Sphingomonas parva TaxID=2555898 RepID=A0A4Y8ZMF1_9SPHN|nr:hypothetical protein [Sphingomonas parva]TFI56335.1 hypothetical protein E2493_20720 [Sphingomonas parva]